MRLTIPPIEIDKDNPFKNDVFGRKEFAERLANLIKNTEDDSLVISLNAQWGEGKTTFVKMLNQYLENQGATTIYFDAFAHDYVDDAFTAISGEIYSTTKNIIPDTRTKKQFTKIAGKFLKVTTKAGTQIAFNKIGMDAEEFKGIMDGTSDIVSRVIENKIKKYDENKKSIESFQKGLGNLAEVVRYKHPNNKQNYPLIFIVDELDRCKPTYALDVIEKIKHFFSVKNIVFILVMNKSQMETSIKSVYGTEINDASIYLQKFINLECYLPKRIDNSKFYKPTDYELYCNYLLDKHNLKVVPTADKKRLQLLMYEMANALELSFRELEKCYTYLTLYYANNEQKKYDDPILPTFLLMIKIKEPGIYKKIKNGNSDPLRVRSCESYEKIMTRLLELDKTSLYAIDFKYIQEILETTLTTIYLPKNTDFDKDIQMLCKSYNTNQPSNILISICNQIDSFEIIL